VKGSRSGIFFQTNKKRATRQWRLVQLQGSFWNPIIKNLLVFYNEDSESLMQVGTLTGVDL